MRRTLIIGVVPLLWLMAACGNDSGTDRGQPSTPPSTTAESGEGALSAVQVTGGDEQTPFKLEFDPPFSVQRTETVVLEPGDGPPVQENTTVLVDYVGVNGNTGKQFDSSWERGGPQTFPLVRDQMIAGFITGLVGQRVGSDLLIAMPPADAYGPQGNPQASISGTDTLLFAVHVVAASDPDPLPMAEGQRVPLPPDVPQLETNAQGQPTGFTTAGAQPTEEPTKLGVYPVIKGDGPTVGKGDLLTVLYVGQLYPDGKVFDESWGSEQPATFQVGAGALIKGWDEGLVGQQEGSRIVLVVPPEFGYGAAGSLPTIPGGATLIFAVDILGIGAS